MQLPDPTIREEPCFSLDVEPGIAARSFVISADDATRLKGQLKKRDKKADLVGYPVVADIVFSSNVPGFDGFVLEGKIELAHPEEPVTLAMPG